MKIVTYNGSALLGKKVKEFIKGILVEFHQPNVIREDLDNLDVYTQNTNILYILLDSEDVVGTIGVIKSTDRTFIKRFYLAKKIRGMGFGKKLFELVMSHIRKQNLDSIYLNCDSVNMNVAYEFYLYNGFEVIDERNDKYVYMRKNLSE